MSFGQKTQAQILLIKAGEDEMTLKVVEITDAIAGFHAQQAVEKLIKALLSVLGVPFEQTHNLERLCTAIETIGERLPSTPLSPGELNDFAVVYRYDLLFQIAAPDRAEFDRNRPPDPPTRRGPQRRA